MTKEEIKKWIEEHKTGIKTVAGLAVMFTGLVVLKKKIGNMSSSNPIHAIPNDELPKTIIELPKELIEMGFETYTDGRNFIEFADYGVNDVIDLTADDLHKVADAIKLIPGFNENSRIQAMFNVWGLEP